jgi:hypothetical protein
MAEDVDMSTRFGLQHQRVFMSKCSCNSQLEGDLLVPVNVPVNTGTSAQACIITGTIRAGVRFFSCE